MRRAKEAVAELWFSIQCLAACFGVWRYDGAWSCAPESWPKGRVIYPNGSISAPMALGNAVDYAFRSGGRVERPERVVS